MKIKVVGQDPSLRNWGWSIGIYDTVTKMLTVQTVGVTQPVLSTGKQVRQNSLDLESAKQLYVAAALSVQGAQAIFVEVPVGSQNSRAAVGYGVCLGVLGALRATGVPYYEVTPSEVKMASVGSKTATKKEMIEWATTKHPEANWPTEMSKGIRRVIEGKAEHQADATAAIYAGITCNEFQRMLPFFSAANHRS